MFRFDVATANLKNDLTENQLTSDSDKVCAIADVVGWQEIKTDMANEVIARIPGWNHVGINHRYQPISWKAKVWEFVNEGTFVISPGGDGTIGRDATWALLAHIATGQKVRFVNTHFTSGCEWDKAWSQLDDQAKENRRAWNECWDNLNVQIDAWREGGGWPIVGVGDYNRKVGEIPKFDVTQKFATPSGIDHIFGIPGGRFTPVKEVTDLNGDVSNNRFHTDHGPRIWRLEFA